MRDRFNIRMPNLPRLGGGMNLYIAVAACIALITSFVAYLITGIMISADLPIVRSFKEPEVVMFASMDAYNISLTWENPKCIVQCRTRRFSLKTDRGRILQENG